MSHSNKPRTSGLNTSLDADMDTAVAESDSSGSIDPKEENRKLLSERDVLNEKYQEQLRIVEVLQSEKSLHCSLEQTSSENQRKVQTSSIDELPAIDASEFRPLRDQSGNGGLTQGYKVVAETTAALSSTVKSSASWCGKKVVSILT